MTRTPTRQALEAWKVAALGGISALAIAWGMLVPVLHRSVVYDNARMSAGIVLSLLVSAWCILDAQVERYDLEQDSPTMMTLLYWLPLIGIIYYFVRIRGLRAAKPLIARALLFSLLVAALFFTAKELSENLRA